MARIPKLDAAGRFLAADVNAQIDARTKATMRADLPALAKELKIGGGSGVEQVSGTVTLDSTGAPIREFYTTGATTFKANGADTLISSFTAVVWRRNAQGSWGYQIVQDAWTTPTPTPDTTAPVAGTLTVTVTDVKADLSVSGASDDRGYVQYSFSKDNGATWTAYQDSATYTFTGLTASTAYQFRHRVKDTAGNVTTGAAVSKTTAAAPQTPLALVAQADFTAADGATVVGLPASPAGALVAGKGGISLVSAKGTTTAALKVQGNRATGNGVSSVQLPSPLTGTRWAITADFEDTSTSGRFGLGVGATYFDNIALVYLSAEGFKVYGPDTKQVGATYRPSVKSGTVTLAYDGTTVTATLNGTAIISGSTTAPAGKTVEIGIGDGTGVFLDNLKVEAA